MKIENSVRSRRNILKNGAAFVIPTVAAFKLSELTVNASGGNHYGNTTPDYNSNDSSLFDGSYNPNSSQNR